MLSEFLCIQYFGAATHHTFIKLSLAPLQIDYKQIKDFFLSILFQLKQK